MIVTITNISTGHREVAVGVTRIAEKERMSHHHINHNTLVLWKEDELVGQVQTNESRVEILPEGM